MTCGVYAIIHVRSGAAYIGGSDHITNRFTWHRHTLRRGIHTSPRLQKLWDAVKDENEFIFVVLQFVRSKKSLRTHEDEWVERWPSKILNEREGNKGWKHAKSTKIKQSISRAIYLDTPGAREALSERAKKQHAEGNFGRATWRS